MVLMMMLSCCMALEKHVACCEFLIYEIATLLLFFFEKTIFLSIDFRHDGDWFLL